MIIQTAMENRGFFCRCYGLNGKQAKRWSEEFLKQVPSVLQFRLKKEEQIQAAIKAAKSVIREKVSINMEQCLMTAPIKGANAIEELLAALNSEGVEIAELLLKKPSFDEVFPF